MLCLRVYLMLIGQNTQRACCSNVLEYARIYLYRLMKQLHTIQLSLLKKLVYSPGLSFSDLRIDKEMENNALHFHLKKLVEIGYVRKDEESGLYILTPSGKEYANTMDT